jgi:hypothetical protein
MGKEKPPKKPRKRVKYTLAIGELVCSLLAEGQSLRKICQLEKMPHISTVMDWLMRGTGEAKRKPYIAFAEQYARAREAQAEVLADEIIDISDDATQDDLFNDEGKRVLNAEWVARSKLRVDARKWVASKLLPKKYGEKTTLEHQGKDGKELPAPQNTVIYLPANGRDNASS